MGQDVARALTLDRKQGSSPTASLFVRTTFQDFATDHNNIINHALPQVLKLMTKKPKNVRFGSDLPEDEEESNTNSSSDDEGTGNNNSKL
jgi:hypothetical protein